VRTTLLAALLLFFSLPVPAAPAQPSAPASPAASVSLRPVFRTADTFAYSFRLESRARQTGGDAAPADATRALHAGTLRLNVLEIDAEGVATVSAVLLGIQLQLERTPAGGEPRTWRAEFEHPAADAPDNAPPAADPVSAVAWALSRADIRFEVSPAGRVHRVTGLDAVAEAAAADADVGPLAMGVFSPASIPRMLERLWLLDAPGPEAPADQPAPESAWPLRKPADEWTMREERPLAYEDSATIVRTMKLAAPRAADAGNTLWPVELRAVGTLKARRGEPDPTIPVLAINAWTEEGSALWDARAGRIASRRDSIVTDTAARLGNRSRSARLELDIQLNAAEAGAPASAR